MAKYNSYIELSPHYESVVDIDSESRHPDMWQEYIVHEDMKGAIEKICDSMKYEDEGQASLLLDSWRIRHGQELCCDCSEAPV